MTEQMTIEMANDEILNTLSAQTLDTAAEKQVYQDICYKVHMLKFKLGKEVPCKQAKYNEYLKLKDELDRIESMNYIGFFTLNFNEGTELSVIKNCIKKITTKKWLTEYHYCFEQRGETIENVKGIHVHLLFLRGNKRPAQACSEIFNSYAKLQGRKYADVKANDFKFYPYEFYEDKQAYMIGDKWDKEKEKKVEIDMIWRKAKDLHLLYSKSMNSGTTYIDLNHELHSEYPDPPPSVDVYHNGEYPDTPNYPCDPSCLGCCGCPLPCVGCSACLC